MKFKLNIVSRYTNFWNTINDLSEITDKLATTSLKRGMNSFNDIFTAFIAKILPLLAPIPSAFNMARILIEEYQREIWEGVILASILDLIGYGLTEKAVTWWFDKSVPELKRFIGVGLAIFYYVLLFVLVYLIEGPGVGLVFPILSTIAALFYALVRHEENTHSAIILNEGITPVVAPPSVPEDFINDKQTYDIDVNEGSIATEEAEFLKSLTERQSQKYKHLFDVVRNKVITKASDFTAISTLGQTTAFNLFRVAVKEGILVQKQDRFIVKFDEV